MAKYDPSKQYTWDLNTEFKMDGNEFGLILNTFRSILDTPEAKQVMLINRASQVAEALLEKQVEAGIVKELEEDKPDLKIVPDKK